MKDSSVLCSLDQYLYVQQALALYGVTKTALVALCKALTPQCATMNIRVNAIAPGVIKTRLSKMVRCQLTLEIHLIYEYR